MSEAETLPDQGTVDTSTESAEALKGIIMDDDVQEDAPAKQEEVESEPEADEPEKAEADDDAVSFDDRQQAKLDQIINRTAGRYKQMVDQEREQRERLEAELNELRQKAGTQSTANPETGEPVIPSMPDPWDENFDDAVKARDEAIVRHAQWRTQQEYLQHQQHQQQAEQIKQLEKRTQDFVGRGKEFGITANDIQQAGQVINDAGGLMPEVVDIILDDEAGPAISSHLARNPDDLEALQSMAPHRAAVYLATQVKPKAVKNARRRAAPPPPVQTDRGHGGGDDDMPKGAQFL